MKGVVGFAVLVSQACKEELPLVEAGPGEAAVHLAV